MMESCPFEGKGDTHMDNENKLRLTQGSRVLVINGEMTDEICTQACIALLQLESENHDEDITIMLNSPGGSVQAGFMLIDTIKVLNCDVETIVMGLAASMGAMVLMAGTKGKRKALPHARIMLHQPLGGAQLMQASDFEITAHEMARVKKESYDFICSCTGKSFSQVAEDCDRDHWMDSKEAMDYGIIDGVVSKDNR